jgi:hypothetical protein
MNNKRKKKTEKRKKKPGPSISSGSLGEGRAAGAD